MFRAAVHAPELIGVYVKTIWRWRDEILSVLLPPLEKKMVRAAMDEIVLRKRGFSNFFFYHPLLNTMLLASNSIVL